MSLPQIRKGKVRLLLDQGNGVQVENDDDLHCVDGDVDDEHRADVDVDDEHGADDDLRLSESWGPDARKWPRVYFASNFPAFKFFFSWNVFEVATIANRPTIETVHET